MRPHFGVAILLVACGGGQRPSLVPGEIGDTVDCADRFGTMEAGEGAKDLCVPSCAGRECGPDGCGGECGTCGPGEACGEEGICGPVKCKNSKDCPGDLVCDTDAGICVVCVADADCDEGERCGLEHTCHLPVACDSDKDCKASGQLCDKISGVCVDCLVSDDCAAAQYCQDGYCLGDECAAEETVCQQNGVLACEEDGSGWRVRQLCGMQEYCEDGVCVAYVCEPSEIWCEGDVYKVCSEDGKSLKYEEDCAAAGQHCFKGACLPTVCDPAVPLFCVDGATTGTCHEDGMGFDSGPCPAEQFCADGACWPWVCEPGIAFCEGAVAKTCNADGSGLAGQTDCSALGKQCSGGKCTDCVPTCAGKDCGPDGCGGVCGVCPSDSYCAAAGLCQLLCGDGQCLDETCETCPLDCGPCPGLCEPACDPELEECIEVPGGVWACAAAMVTVPAGIFWMGCNGNCPEYTGKEEPCTAEWGSKHNYLPYHPVDLDKYAIDRTEVTAGQYAACVLLGGCESPGTAGLCTYAKAGQEALPINCVTWTQADAYCTWAGKQLCSEAQWEKAARGGCEMNGGDEVCKAQNRIYPWGDEVPTCDKVVMEGCPGDIMPVCSKSPAGDSPYGVCDMSGNVWDWVADWYLEDYYCNGPAATGTGGCYGCTAWYGWPEPWVDPPGPLVAERRGKRGGTIWGMKLKSSIRWSDPPTLSAVDTGFRCCKP